MKYMFDSELYPLNAGVTVGVVVVRIEDLAQQSFLARETRKVLRMELPSTSFYIFSIFNILITTTAFH
jgi:hypothetical protein